MAVRRVGLRVRARAYIQELRARGFVVQLDWWPAQDLRGLHLVARDRAHLGTLTEEDVGMLAWLEADMQEVLEADLEVNVCGPSAAR